MILDEPPPKLIRDTITNFDMHNDRHALERISEGLSGLHALRDLRLQKSEDALKALSRTLNSLSSQHNDLLQSHSDSTHASEIASLDTSKFRIAKSASDTEIEAERLGGQLADLQARLQELELQGTEAVDGRRGEDSDLTSLRLKVYRSLGCTVDGKGDGVYNRMVVRNLEGKADVHIVRVGKEEGTRAFTANYLWDRM